MNWLLDSCERACQSSISCARIEKQNFWTFSKADEIVQQCDAYIDNQLLDVGRIHTHKHNKVTIDKHNKVK